MARVRAGDHDALLALYDRYGRLAFAIALRALHDPSDAEDVVQEVFIQVWTRSDGYEPSRGAVATWIAVIARTRAIDRLRRRQRLLPTELRPPDDGPGAEALICLRLAVEALTPEQRIVIELAFYEGLSQSEIASRLHAPLGTVKGRLRSGIRRLRERLSYSAVRGT